MALTIAKIAGMLDRYQGNERIATRKITGDNSYPAGGYALTPMSFGGRIIKGVSLLGVAAAAGARLRVIYDYAAKKLRFYKEGGLTDYAPGGGDIKGATNVAAAAANADQNAAPTNDALWLARTTFTVLAGTMTPTTQPDVPRNVVITITNDSGGALDLFEGTTTFAVTGTDKDGLALTESITLVSTAGNKSVANTKFRMVFGSKAFRTITSIAITNAPAGGLKGSLGPGTRLGLPTELATATNTDVKNLTISAARQATSATAANTGGVDTTNNTVNVGDVADGADVGVQYEQAGEVSVGEDLSGVEIRAEIVTLN